MDKARRKKAQFSDPVQDRLPPHSEEAEAGVLGCVLLEPARLLDAVKTFQTARGTEMFYAPQNQTVYSSMLRLAKKHPAFDLIALKEDLKSHGKLADAGGMEYLASLPDKVPSAANLKYYLDIVCEKFECRKIIRTCAEVTSRIYEYTGPIEDLMFSVKSELAQVSSDLMTKENGRFYTVDDLDKFDPKKDSTCILGNRWLCRAGKLLVPAASGAGKSSLGMQMLMLFALGKDFCGVKPARKLTSLICGDENDEGDLAEMFQGTRDFLKLDSANFEHLEDFDALRNNMKFWHCPALTGMKFLSAIEAMLLKEPRDIVLLDPLVSFAGVDLTQQASASVFLREGLSRISQTTGVCWAVIHHTTKPPREKGKSGWKNSDYQYAGAGSFDLPGWARAVMTLDESSDGIYRLILAKRGARAGACHPNGEPATTLWMRHARKGIHWEQIDPPEERDQDPREGAAKGGKPSEIKRIAASNLASFCAGCKTEGEGLNEISRRLESCLAGVGEDVSARTCKNIIPLLVANGKLVKGKDLLYRKGHNA